MYGIIVFSLSTLLVVWSVKIKNPHTCKKYPCLVFHDDFNKLDFTIWEHLITSRNTGNNEFQYYTNNRSNSFIRDGILYLKPTLTGDAFHNGFLYSGILDLWQQCTSNRGNDGCFKKGTNQSIINPIQSASIRTDRSFSFRYGKVEVKAMLPEGDWIWPAIRLMPKHYVYGPWPASGEINLCESRGNSNLEYNGELIGNQMVHQTLHWGPFSQANKFRKTTARATMNNSSFSNWFHVFGLEWDENKIDFSIDNEVTLSVPIGEGGFWKFGNFEHDNPGLSNPWRMGTKMAPFDEEFYIVLFVAVGGTSGYFIDSSVPNPPWDNNEKTEASRQFWEARDKWLSTWHGNRAAMKIDYVKVWSNEDV